MYTRTGSFLFFVTEKIPSRFLFFFFCFFWPVEIYFFYSLCKTTFLFFLWRKEAFVYQGIKGTLRHFSEGVGRRRNKSLSKGIFLRRGKNLEESFLELISLSLQIPGNLFLMPKTVSLPQSGKRKSNINLHPYAHSFL